jgi:hypothetical protein
MAVLRVVHLELSLWNTGQTVTLVGVSSALSCCQPARRLNIYSVHRIVLSSSSCHLPRGKADSGCMYASIACLLLYEDYASIVFKLKYSKLLLYRTNLRLSESVVLLTVRRVARSWEEGREVVVDVCGPMRLGPMISSTFFPPLRVLGATTPLPVDDVCYS